MSTTTPQQELLHTQTSTETENGNNQKSNSQLKAIDKIEGTPFAIVTLDNMKSFVALGNMRITEFMDRREAEHAINTKSWEILFGVVQSLVTTMISNPEYTQVIIEKLEKGGIKQEKDQS